MLAIVIAFNQHDDDDDDCQFKRKAIVMRNPLIEYVEQSSWRTWNAIHFKCVGNGIFSFIQTFKYSAIICGILRFIATICISFWASSSSWSFFLLVQIVHIYRWKFNWLLLNRLNIPKCMHTFMCTKNGKSQGMRFQGCCYFNHYLLCHRWRYLDMTFYSTRHKMLSGTPFKWMSQKPTVMTTFVLLWVLFAHFILTLSVYLFCLVEFWSTTVHSSRTGRFVWIVLIWNISNRAWDAQR